MPNGKTTRTRDILFKHANGRSRGVDTFPNYPVTLDQYHQGAIVGKQVTVSEGHSFPGKPGKLKDIGGPFRTQKNRVLFNGSTALQNHVLSNVEFGVRFTYSGPVFIVPTSPTANKKVYEHDFPPPYDSSDALLQGLGTKAIARCKPTNSIADLAVTLGELKKEGLPSLIGASTWKARAKDLREKSRAVGSDYLNVQFGWVPLISDIQNTVTAAQQSDKILAQFERDSGRVVRRRYKFPRTTITEPTTSSTVYSLGSHAQGALLSFVVKNGGSAQYVLKKTRTIEQERWFSGAFTYHLPTGSDTFSQVKRSAAQLRKLYGISLDPEVLWNLSPWSWAVDWAVNIGDILSNASDAITDGLVMPYGYMMEHTIVTDHYEATLPHLGSGTQSISLITETKKRVQASPYGFGLTWENFSPYQISILAALGISRR